MKRKTNFDSSVCTGVHGYRFPAERKDPGTMNNYKAAFFNKPLKNDTL